jgi:hypothetical protein
VRVCVCAWVCVCACVCACVCVKVAHRLHTTRPQAHSRLPSPPPAPTHVQHGSWSSIVAARRRSQGSPVGDSFTRLIIMLLMDADARASAAQNAIADLDAWTTLEVMMQTTLEGLNVAD